MDRCRLGWYLSTPDHRWKSVNRSLQVRVEKTDVKFETTSAVRAGKVLRK